MVATPTTTSGWNHIPIGGIEDLKEAVYGAGLDAVQLSRGALHGSLAFAESDQITYSSGYLAGQITLTGPLSESMVTLGVGVNMAPGSRHWLNEVSSGGIGVFLPGDEHDAFYTPHTVYACAALTYDHLEEVAADLNLVLDARQLGGSGIILNRVSKHALATLQRAFKRIHSNGNAGVGAPDVGRYMLECMIDAIARPPRATPGGREAHGHSKIVSRAQDFILANLETPLSIHAIARAAFASQSTLYRAFREVLSETPQSFVRKLRLNRIRQDLATDEEARCTITIIANRWGVGELGRLSGWYRELFDELPSHTRARCLETLRSISTVNGMRKAAT
jgi:AraC-like DNA-binding protein